MYNTGGKFVKPRWIKIVSYLTFHGHVFWTLLNVLQFWIYISKYRIYWCYFYVYQGWFSKSQNELHAQMIRTMNALLIEDNFDKVVPTYYRQTSNKSCTTSQNFNVSSRLAVVCAQSICSQVLNPERRCNRSSTDRQCSKYIIVIKNLLPTKMRFILDVWR